MWRVGQYTKRDPEPRCEHAIKSPREIEFPMVNDSRDERKKSVLRKRVLAY